MSILIVDDAPEMRASLEAFLETQGHRRILTAGSAHEAFEILGLEGGRDETRVEVVLLDVGLPDVDGIETCRRIKEASHLKHLPVLMVTANADLDTLQKAFDAGACDFLAKPVQPPELIARMRSALNLKREIDHCRERERELERVTAQLRKLNEELRSLAVLDELTGTANRRFFNIILGQEWARAMRDVVPLSLVMIDVDYFKYYNDHYGHQRGDDCLSQVAGALRALVKRPGDCVARYGGEEFAIILAHTGLQGAWTVAEQARARIEALSLAHAGSPGCRHVTVSLGVATVVPERGSTSAMLVAAADLALYEAKHLGRNRVRVFQGSLEQAVVCPPTA